MTPFVIPSKFTAIDGVSSVTHSMAGRVRNDFDRMATGVARQERLFRKLTPGIGSAAKSLLNYASAGSLIAAGIGTGKEIIDTETAEQSLSAVTGVTGKLFDQFKENIHAVAADTKKSAKDIAGSYEVVGSAMSQYLQDPKALQQITEAGVTLSKASRQDLVPSLENLTSIMNQFNLAADKADDTINRLTAGEIVGSLRTSQLAFHMQEVGASAFSSNVTLAESIALLESLAKQMKTEKIGVGARNILSRMSSAKGLDKAARMELKKNGVDMGLLMDKSKTLSERLHELSKIQNDSVAIIKVFGDENKTAASVIFNQLSTYDKYLADIKRTNEAQNQAAINSKTFAVAVEQLKNTFVNYLTASDGVHSGLDLMKNGIHYVTDNMDSLISMGIGAVKVWALWKGSILVANGVLAAHNATMVASRVIGAALYYQDMLKWYAATNGVSVATARLTLIQTALNDAWLANPIGIIIGGVAALAGGIYFLTQREREYNEVLERQMELNIEEHISRQADETARLAKHWEEVGFNIKDATIKTLQFQVAQASDNLSKAKSKTAAATQANIDAYDNALFPAFSSEVSRANSALSAAKSEEALAQADKLGTTNSLISNAKIFGFTPQETNSILRGDQVKTGAPKLNDLQASGPKQDFSNSPIIQEMNKNIVAAIKEGFTNAKSNVNVNVLPAAGGITPKQSF